MLQWLLSTLFTVHVSVWDLSYEEITTIKVAINIQSSTSVWDEVLHIQYINTSDTEYICVKTLPSIQNHMNLIWVFEVVCGFYSK